MIASRVRSWITRSRFAAGVSGNGGAVTRLAFSSRCTRAAFDLAAILPRNHPSKEDMESAKTQGEQNVAPARGREKRNCTQHHEAEAHQGHDANREGASRHNRGAVEQQPHARNAAEQAGSDEHERQERADEDGWGKT